MKEHVHVLADLKNVSPDLFGIPTGTKLDEMFYTIEEKDGRFVRKPLNGIPYKAIINVVGVPDTGKSLLAEQFALYQAHNDYKVMFVTVESPSQFLYGSMKLKAEYLGLDFEKIKNNIIVIDAALGDELRDNPKALMDTMAYVIKEKKTTITVIDSITGLYEAKEVMARQIVRQFFNFLKKWNQTGMFVSQKRSSQGAETAEAAGGLAVAHIVDGTIVMDKKLIETKWDINLYNMPLGSILRTIRIDGCRLAGHDSKTWVFEITEAGTIKIKKPLEQIVNTSK